MSTGNYWMPLYVGDYLADTMHLSGPEHGAYLLLLMHSWRTGPLPDDDRKLAAIARTTATAWKVMRETVMAFFTPSDVGFVQGRLEQIRDEQAAKNEQRRSAGKASAQARKTQRETNDRSTNVDAPLPSRTREPEPELEKESTPHSPPKGAKCAVTVALPAWLPADAWADWVAYRKQGKGWTERAAVLTLNALAQFRDEGHDPRAVIEQSIANGWRGLFALRGVKAQTIGPREAAMRAFTAPSTPFDFDGIAEEVSTW